MAWGVRYVVRSDNISHASIFQCGFRFNTYIGFALCSRIFGEEGFALLALIMAFWVPISNTLAGVLAVRRRPRRTQSGLGETVRWQFWRVH